MFPFIRVQNSNRLSRIISSHPTFSNVPSGLVTDPFRESLFDIRAPLGARYFEGFGAREGETIATPPPTQPGVLPPVSKDVGLAMDLSRMGAMLPLSQMIEGKKKTLGPTMAEINKIFDSMVSNKKRTRPKQTKVRTNTTRKKEMKKAVRAGIKASQEGDVETAKMVTKREALSAGIPDALATILEKEAGKAIKKHAVMENREVEGIVEKVERKQPLKRNEDIKHGGSKGRGRPAGSRGSGVKVPQLKDALKKIGYKNVTLNKPQLMGELSEVSSRSGVSMKDILDAPRGGILSNRLIEVVRAMGKTQRKFDVKKRLPRRPKNKGPPSTPKKKR